MGIATRMSLTRNGTECSMTPKHKKTGPVCNLSNLVNVICSKVSSEEESDLHGCIDKRKVSSDSNLRQPLLSFGENCYSVNSFHHFQGNQWLAFWLFLVSSSYFFLRENVNSFRSCSGVNHAEEVDLCDSDRTISSASTENDAATPAYDTCSYSEISRSPHSASSTKCDAVSEIYDLDKARYMHSLLSLEDEDSEWLSDSKAYYGTTSSDNPSTPFSYMCDSFTDTLDADMPSFWDSLLSLEGEQSERISNSDSKQEMNSVLDGSPCSSFEGSFSTTSSSSPFSGISLEYADLEEFNADEPLFWPFEEKHNWSSEEPWSSFCTSPRKSFVSNSRPKRVTKGCKKKGNSKASCNVNSETSRSSKKSCSAEIVPIKSEDEKIALPLNNSFLDEDLDLNKDFHLGIEYVALDPIETLVGLKEFDGHEGLVDWDFNDVFMLD
ncbi:hypothetical protein RJT34_28352 [Clitoria ternatea]|uniref:Uncharacterized protein n=1 Tax=Clitoria ternatea TaxID=43366 RepID=A0AAN9IBH1_CLITE